MYKLQIDEGDQDGQSHWRPQGPERENAIPGSARPEEGAWRRCLPPVRVCEEPSRAVGPARTFLFNGYDSSICFIIQLL